MVFNFDSKNFMGQSAINNKQLSEILKGRIVQNVFRPN